MSSGYQFTFGPWNIHEGSDPFGPTVRPTIEFARKLKTYQQLGFSGVQFHDDDVVVDIDSKSAAQIEQETAAMKRLLDDHGLVAEFTAPRLWEDPRGVDGGYTANDPATRRWAIDRTKRAIDVGQQLGVDLMVIWFAREGTYVREAKNAIDAHRWLIDALNELLEYAPNHRFAIEPKPNEPMDQNYIPTIGHAIALGQMTCAPDRMGSLIETAHSLLVGLDPSDDFAFALACDKLWSVHLNDQNGLKFDQDKTFGSVNLRSAYNMVRVLELGGYAGTGRYVGLDVKAMRTQKAEVAEKHLANSKRIFEMLVEKVRTFNSDIERQCIAEMDYEALEMAVLEHLMT